jgi:hypothetical protein
MTGLLIEAVIGSGSVDATCLGSLWCVPTSRSKKKELLNDKKTTLALLFENTEIRKRKFDL